MRGIVDKGIPDIILADGTVVTGDGRTILRNATLLLRDGYIESMRKLPIGKSREQPKVIDLEGKLVIPGVINHHAHGILPGPLFPTGAIPLAIEQIMENLNRHLLEGTTTILSMDGFATQKEVESVNSAHPMNIKAGTTHAPKNLAPAKALDGAGLKDEHEKLTVKGRIAEGAPAIGEIGAGGTLGGMLQDYKYIPEAVKAKTGVGIDPSQARRLKNAVLGRQITREAFNATGVKDILEELRLSDTLTVEGARELVDGCVLPLLIWPWRVTKRQWPWPKSTTFKLFSQCCAFKG